MRKTVPGMSSGHDRCGSITLLRLPFLDTLWGLFRPDRLICGSNWPVMGGRIARFSVVQAIVTAYFRAKGQDALDKVFWKDATAAYRCGCCRAGGAATGGAPS